jgi:hypothetical protein
VTVTSYFGAHSCGRNRLHKRRLEFDDLHDEGGCHTNCHQNCENYPVRASAPGCFCWPRPRRLRGGHFVLYQDHHTGGHIGAANYAPRRLRQFRSRVLGQHRAIRHADGRVANRSDEVYR